MAGMSSLSAAQRFHAYANPARFMALSSRLVAPLGMLSALVIAAGLWFALVASPPDYQQGETVRIMYVHVPSAWLAMFGYSVMAVASAVALIFRHPLADVAAKSAAPIGAAFTFLALVTGSLWGRPMWGTWWEWGDARLVSMLILLFLYLGYMALWATIEEPVRAARAAAVLALVGSINLPVIRYSVDWWNTLHQPASVFRMDGPTIASSMLLPLGLMALGFTVLFVTLLLVRMRAEIMRRRVRNLRLARAASGAGA
ncbi:heme ABC transporter permease [Parvibaculum sp.]|jgi:heme exporter protein C|uniref:heme ABC transporter permease n=1 Tax=Parvibaculum sp. TaxID=2024848 RepID=UPI001B11B81E|nr:heme ABC transporter permease [Parvibaculum sp.]MBO6635869.1 heme ABC transporter permease [Parvibaculum sp.]MBO6677292.1 heme ABC transporter permease [Parvibaculum sp.]MBO6684948.1 heme ABC transporter permease [Parvibaculum sp.]MBO6904715.1 heme ABC transporter permease [Parvibaculum sp.]